MELRLRKVRAIATGVGLIALAGCRARIASLDVSPRRLAIYGTEQSKELSVRALDRKGTPLPEMPPVAWTSSDPKVAEVSGNGHIVPKAPGKTLVTARSGEISASASIEVVDLSRIDLAPALLRLVGPPGTTARLELSGKNASGKSAPLPAVAWIVRDPKVASIASDGTVTSIAAGKTAVTAKVGDLVAESELQVDLRKVSRIDLRPETAILHVGETQKLTVTAYDENGLPIPNAGAHLVADSPNVVRVLGDGTITGLVAGTSVVTASVGDRRAQATVLVD
jgi:uncharacterized protein YjdB